MLEWYAERCCKPTEKITCPSIIILCRVSRALKVPNCKPNLSSNDIITLVFFMSSWCGAADLDQATRFWYSIWHRKSRRNPNHHHNISKSSRTWVNAFLELLSLFLTLSEQLKFMCFVAGMTSWIMSGQEKGRNIATLLDIVVMLEESILYKRQGHWRVERGFFVGLGSNAIGTVGT